MMTDNDFIEFSDAINLGMMLVKKAGRPIYGMPQRHQGHWCVHDVGTDKIIKTSDFLNMDEYEGQYMIDPEKASWFGVQRTDDMKTFKVMKNRPTDVVGRATIKTNY